jgi:hypothetical protein
MKRTDLKNVLELRYEVAGGYTLAAINPPNVGQTGSVWRWRMKPRLAASLLWIVGLFAFSVPLLAHHGTGVAYEVEKEVTLKGTVAEWIWSNPHCGLLFDVTDEKGNVVHWGAELGNPHMLSQAGLGRDTFKPGDTVTVVGHPARSGAPRVSLSNVTLADGRVLPEKGRKGNGVKLNDEPGQ